VQQKSDGPWAQAARIPRSRARWKLEALPSLSPVGRSPRDRLPSVARSLRDRLPPQARSRPCHLILPAGFAGTLATDILSFARSEASALRHPACACRLRRLDGTSGPSRSATIDVNHTPDTSPGRKSGGAYARLHQPVTTTPLDPGSPPTLLHHPPATIPPATIPPATIPPTTIPPDKKTQPRPDESDRGWLPLHRCSLFGKKYFVEKMQRRLDRLWA
jgi:hypothetical protein